MLGETSTKIIKNKIACEVDFKYLWDNLPDKKMHNPNSKALTYLADKSGSILKIRLIAANNNGYKGG
ncbi:MAG: hypothetical protein PHW11_07430 [Anaerolineaceae bacterium]|jgi:hypothetical protein|nr:hypothetical protein [Anaerolineaceae bacterium]MDD4042933.1 hypothetical protein [Anaerolineaceae bacterium]MDD4577353.1 hypothetical protein [Anaerolineaceae bacterium]